MSFIEGNSYNTYIYKVEDSLDLSVKDFLYEKLFISTAQIREFKKNKSLFVNGNLISLDAKIRKNDIIKFIFLEKEHYIFPNEIDIDIVYEDKDIICVNKKSDIVSHPTKGHFDNTLSNAVRYYSLNKGEDFKPRLINRLDRDTTGIIIFGKNPHSQHYISKQINGDEIVKKYIALVDGIMAKDEDIIDIPILKSADGIRREINPMGQNAVTKYKVLKRYNDFTKVEVELFTGRTHQIRVHFSAIGHTLIGDELYGYDMKKLNSIINRQALHAYYLKFRSPRKEHFIEIVSELPTDMKTFIDINM